MLSAASCCLDRPLYGRRNRFQGHAGSLGPAGNTHHGISLSQSFLFYPINLCTFDILILYLLPNSSRGDGLRCCGLCSCSVAVAVSHSDVRIWCRCETAVCCATRGSRLEGGLDPARDAAERSLPWSSSLVDDTALWFMFEITDFKCHLH